MQKKYQTVLVDLDNTLANDEENKKYAYKKYLKNKINCRRVEKNVKVWKKNRLSHIPTYGN